MTQEIECLNAVIFVENILKLKEATRSVRPARKRPGVGGENRETRLARSRAGLLQSTRDFHFVFVTFGALQSLRNFTQLFAIIGTAIDAHDRIPPKET